MGLYRNLSFAALLDDRNVPIQLGQVGEISEARAKALMTSRPDASLERVGCEPDCQKSDCAESPTPPPQKRSTPKPKPEPEKVEAEADGGSPGLQQDTRAKALELSPKALKDLGRALGMKARLSGIKAKVEAWPEDDLSTLEEAIEKLGE